MYLLIQATHTVDICAARCIYKIISVVACKLPSMAITSLGSYLMTVIAILQRIDILQLHITQLKSNLVITTTIVFKSNDKG